MDLYSLHDVAVRRGVFRLCVDELHLEHGRIHAITGPNGSGKTTLLNLLAFLSEPWQGRLDFCGTTVSSVDDSALPAHRRRVGYLMQNPYLFNTTVHRNIRYGLDIRGISGGPARQRVAEIAETLGLTHLLPANAHRLSGGEAQRVALARTLAFNPEVLLLDEPTANVDKRNIHVVEQLVRTINDTARTSIIITTHSIEQAHRMTDRIIAIDEGAVIC